MNKLIMRPFHIMLALVIIAQSAITLPACIWDSDTLFQEKWASPEMAAAILGSPPPPDPRPLHERISKLNALPRKSDPGWWNDLAGAHLRLGNPADAAKLLESVVETFPNDYGIHANLGTAYHLLGRYADAERQIARDLEINPDAHFGLERYHLALLQYLMRDEAYRMTHLYVDELSYRLEWKGFRGFGSSLLPGPLKADQEDPSFPDIKPPSYRAKWNLSEDPNFTKGVLYMASLNPKEPACSVMLGIACLRKDNPDLHLAVAAFKRAVELGSPQRERLEVWIQGIEEHIDKATQMRFGLIKLPFYIAAGALIAVLVIAALRWRRRKRNNLYGQPSSL